MKSINDLESSNIQLHFLGNSDVMLDRFISLYELKDTPFQKVLLCPSSQFNDEIDTTANEYTDSVEVSFMARNLDYFYLLKSIIYIESIFFLNIFYRFQKF